METKRINFTNERRKRDRTLEKFWDDFKSLKSVQIKLSLVQAMSQLVYQVGGRRTLQQKRARFNRMKAKYYRAEGKCMICKGEAFVRHHVIQLRNGGSNSGRNLMRVCFQCHEKIHPWLKNDEL